MLITRPSARGIRPGLDRVAGLTGQGLRDRRTGQTTPAERARAVKLADPTFLARGARAGRHDLAGTWWRSSVIASTRALEAVPCVSGGAAGTMSARAQAEEHAVAGVPRSGRRRTGHQVGDGGIARPAATTTNPTRTKRRVGPALPEFRTRRDPRSRPGWPQSDNAGRNGRPAGVLERQGHVRIDPKNV